MDDLHYDKVDKVDGARYVQLGLVVVLINVIGQFSKRKPDVGKLDTVSLQIPIRHGE
jgi:hypothetical protein